MTHLKSETERTLQYVDNILFIPVSADARTTCKYRYHWSYFF